jgi:uncharacterized membrane protein YgdD (TMEM256/DUF423 family)
MSKLAYITGFFLGFTGVILGAMAAHALEKTLSSDMLDAFETAVRFQMYHALLLIILGFVMERHDSKVLNLALYTMLVGILLFSGSIYLLVLTPVKVGIVTPIGGLILIFSWGALVFWALKKKPNE